jgi:fucose permease
VKWLTAIPSLIALTMHLLIRFIPSVVANAVSVSMVGLAFGPLFPSAMNMLSDILPAEQHLVGMALL